MEKKYLFMFCFVTMMVSLSAADDGSAAPEEKNTSSGMSNTQGITGRPGAAPENRSWAQGLSVYLAEYMAEEKKGKGWAYRKRELLDYRAYVTAKKETSLKAYTGGEDEASKAIGQGKAALVFHLLRKLVGEETFLKASGTLLEQARSGPGSWDDVKSVFEKESGRDLGWFFTQWVDRKGLPDLREENAKTQRSGDGYEISFDLLQRGDVYTLDVPLAISFMRGGSKTESIRLDAEKKRVTLSVDDEPAMVVIDGDYDVPRRLTEEETPPLLAAVFAGEKPFLVPPVSEKDLYAGMIDAWKQRGALVREGDNIKEADIRSSSFLVLGSDNPFLNRLYGKAGTGNGELSFAAKKNPWNPDKVVVLVQAKSAEAAKTPVRDILRYGEYSSVSFGEGRTVTAKTAESRRGIQMEIREQAAVLDVSLLKTLTNAIEGAERKKIVYVGEYHDRFSNHTIELQVIKGLSRKNPKLAIGMEMFQRPFQKTLDDYIAGAIDELEFLKQSEYFKRWGFDYNLYKPILDYARTEKIPVIALNLRREITDKVAQGGLDSLTEDEKKEIPQHLDFSDEDYRARLRQIFDQHKSAGERNFDFFFQAQVLWDETMAMSIDEYLKKNPEQRMVVLAGGGHLAYGSGIPRRAFRRNGFEYAIILNDGDIDRDIADYIVFPQPLDGMTAPRLMAVLKEENGKVSIVDFQEGSVARKAGLKTGDTIMSVDGRKISSVEDLKIALFYKKKGETLAVRALRRRFLFGDKELDIEVHL